jgi:hypothetical protein
MLQVVYNETEGEANAAVTHPHQLPTNSVCTKPLKKYVNTSRLPLQSVILLHIQEEPFSNPYKQVF